MDDCINRQAAIDALTERNLVVHMDSVNDGLVASCHRSAQRIIANIPAADVRSVVRGKWEHDWETGCSVCSACGDGYLWEDFKGVADWNFCPNCGAGMREES
jgi:hypothetical protein